MYAHMHRIKKIRNYWVIITRYKIINGSYFLLLCIFIYTNFSFWPWPLNWYWTCLQTTIKLDKIYKQTVFRHWQTGSTRYNPWEKRNIWDRSNCFSTTALISCLMVFSATDQGGGTNQSNSLVQLRRQILELQDAEAGRIFRAGYIRKESCVWGGEGVFWGFTRVLS